MGQSEIHPDDKAESADDGGNAEHHRKRLRDEKSSAFARAEQLFVCRVSLHNPPRYNRVTIPRNILAREIPVLNHDSNS